jgi:murein DD-endopeptidase MepM/ murein hydrolase activator NlpD
VKLLLKISVFFLLYTLSVADVLPADSPSVAPDVNLETPSRTEKTLCQSFNDLNNRIRDGRISRSEATLELKRLLVVIRQQYYRQGGGEFSRSSWVFPLAGYDGRSIEKRHRHGYRAKGYDFFRGNRHGGHPSLDIFIRDRNQDQMDDKSGKPVSVLSMTGGIVVAIEKEWEEGSLLRGGKYIWVYDPGEDLLVYYAHNREISVNIGDLVKPGDKLAIVGRSGFNAAKRRSPTHLHMTVVRVNSGRPVPMDVYRWLLRSKTIQ